MVVGPALGMKSHHNLVGKASFVGSPDDLRGRMKHQALLHPLCLL